MGRDSSVGITTRYGVDGPEIESRWGARFSATVQTGPWAHLTSCTMGTGCLPGVRRQGRGVDHPNHIVSTATPLIPLWAFVACSRVNFSITCTVNKQATSMACSDQCEWLGRKKRNYSLHKTCYCKAAPFCLLNYFRTTGVYVPKSQKLCTAQRSK